MLAQALDKYKDRDVIIYALPRGGAVVAAEVAKALHKPLDLIIIRKIGHPYNPEYALCAISINGHLVCNEAELAQVDKGWFQGELEKQKIRAKEQYRLYLKGKRPTSAKGKTAIIVDDGIATGLTMEAAVKEVRRQHPKEIVVAVPVTPKEIAAKLESEGNEVVTLEIPKEFTGSVGSYYDFFPQVTDKEVITFLHFV